MDTEGRLTSLADRYRAQGYRVVVSPGPTDLPEFAKAFNVEIVARREDGSALVSAKKSPRELEADPNVSKLAELVQTQPGWRFDVVVFGPSEEALMPDWRDAKEPSEDEVRVQIENVRKLLDANLKQQPLVLAWSVLEAAMRCRLHANGEEAGWGTSPRTMLNELLSSGVLSNGAFRDLERLFQARSAIVHGFSTTVVEPRAVDFILDVARRLVEESELAKQPA
jgi:REase_AHJR-like